MNTMPAASNDAPGNAYSLVVFGGGAAGIFCAVNAAKMNPELKVLVVEKSAKVLSKVKVSGGGRCNVTHSCFDISELIKKYPRGKHFLKKTFHQFNPLDTIEWFEKRGLPLKTEADGRMFPASNSSQAVIDCLLHEMDQYRVDLKLHFEVIEVNKTNGGFLIKGSKGEEIYSDAICVACGGFPKPAQYGWLLQLGHTIELPVPSLFTFNVPNNPITQLMGISVERAVLKIVGSKLSADGPLLITHWGLSGPAVLRLSAWGARELAVKQYAFDVMVNWIPAYNEQSLQQEWPSIRQQFGTQKIGNKNPFWLAQRLWNFLLQQAGISEELHWAQLPAKGQNKLIQNLTASLFTIRGKTTFKEEFVTCGGIKTGEIDANTMQSRIVPNLYFAGEIMDIDGITGGFNFQHAWTSGWIAAKAISQRLNG